MQALKEKLPIIIVSIIFIAICGFAFYFVMVRSTDYFTQIDNSGVRQLPNNEYEYELRAYDEHGKMRDVTFKAYKKLREDAFLKLEIMTLRGVVNWEEVQFDELPYDVKNHYKQP